MAESNRWKNIVKCYPYEDKRLLSWKPPFLVQIKYDGDRCVGRQLQNGNYMILSSEENPFFCLPHINEALDKLGITWVPDGELYSHELFLEGMASTVYKSGHDFIHSICSREVNIHPRYREMQFHIFDFQDLTITQSERMLRLNSMADAIKPPLFLAPYWICETIDEVKKVYDEVIEQKYEGIIIRNLFAPYEINKRSRWIMKFKPKRVDNYKIVGWNEEISKDGIPKRRIGSIILSSQEGDFFSVSAGLDDEEREKYWLCRDDLAGHEAIVHYQHLTNKGIPKGCFDLEIML
jgi:hypothetical protein